MLCLLVMLPDFSLVSAWRRPQTKKSLVHATGSQSIFLNSLGPSRILGTPTRPLDRPPTQANLICPSWLHYGSPTKQSRHAKESGVRLGDVKLLSKRLLIRLKLDSRVVEAHDKRLCASFINYCEMPMQRGRGLVQDYTGVTTGPEAAGMPLMQRKQLRVGLARCVLYLVSTNLSTACLNCPSDNDSEEVDLQWHQPKRATGWQ